MLHGNVLIWSNAVHIYVPWKLLRTYRLKQFFEVTSLTRESSALLDQLAAKALYMGARPFRTYEEPAMLALLRTLQPAWKPPHRKLFATTLLDTCYEDLRAKLQVLWGQATYLNIITDESSNITMHRIFNVSLHTSMGAMHYVSKDILEVRLNGAEIAKWIHQHALELSDNTLTRINSIATDTCNTMCDVWKR